VVPDVSEARRAVLLTEDALTGEVGLNGPTRVARFAEYVSQYEFPGSSLEKP
jgi:hypothetical protein